MKKDLSERIAILRFKWHANMVDVVNVANQLHFISDLKAEQLNKKHVMTIATDVIPRIKEEHLKEMVDKMKGGRS